MSNNLVYLSSNIPAYMYGYAPMPTNVPQQNVYQSTVPQQTAPQKIVSSTPKWSGAGCVVISNGSLLLVRDRHTGEFNDFGGKNDSDSRSITASKELYEESRMVLYVSPQQLLTYNFVDIPAGQTMYRSYIVHINRSGICTEYKNKLYDQAYIAKAKQNHAYDETDAMLRFPISKLEYETNGWLKEYQVDDNGNKHKLNNRIRKILHKMKQNNQI